MAGIPGIVPVWKAGKIALGVGHIGIDQVETVIFTGNHPALARMGSIGQIERNGEWFTLEKMAVPE